MNFGQRYLELETSYIKDEELDTITLNVAQMPPNANIFQPGPAYIFLVVDGVPAKGEVRPSFLVTLCLGLKRES